jgi:DNA-binding XRE family transcriptional regulator
MMPSALHLLSHVSGDGYHDLPNERPHLEYARHGYECYGWSIDRGLDGPPPYRMATRPDGLIGALASRVRQLRHEGGWTQQTLADHAGLDRSYIAGVEAGLRNPTVKALGKVAQGLGVSLSQLLATVDRRASVRRRIKPGRLGAKR